MSNENHSVLEKPGSDSQMEADLCHVVDLAGGVNVRQGDVLNSLRQRLMDQYVQDALNRPYRPFDDVRWVYDALDMGWPAR